MTIAVTGPLASGKSTFVGLLGELGAETVSADEMVHHLLAKDRETIDAVVQRFGEGVAVAEGNGIDRKSLGREVFADAGALKDLEGILHPRVREETERRAARSDARLFVAEVPLLFEGGERAGERFDFTVAVVTPEGRRREWALARGMDEEQRRAMEERQLSQDEKARRADVVVDNDGDLDRLRRQAKDLVERVPGGEVGGERGDEKGS